MWFRYTLTTELPAQDANWLVKSVFNEALGKTLLLRIELNRLHLLQVNKNGTMLANPCETIDAVFIGADL